MKRILFLFLVLTGCASYKMRVEYPECIVPGKTSRSVEVSVSPQIPSQADGIITAIVSLF